MPRFGTGDFEAVILPTGGEQHLPGVPRDLLTVDHDSPFAPGARDDVGEFRRQAHDTIGKAKFTVTPPHEVALRKLKETFGHEHPFHTTGTDNVSFA